MTDVYINKQRSRLSPESVNIVVHLL